MIGSPARTNGNGRKPAEPAATVLITTKNRVDDLCRAIQSALDQTIHVEVIVVDDGSTDGTSQTVATRFPAVRLEQYSSSAGYIARRNEGARLANGSIIFSLDDDAIFSSPHLVEQTLSNFNGHARIAAVAIPCIDVLKSPEFRQPLPDRENIYITSEYIGTAHAVRRDLFLELGGYREELVHQGEERDFCLRLLDAGWFVRLGISDPIHHFESPQRDVRRQDMLGRRNDILFAWQNAPWGVLPAHLLGTTLNGLRFGARVGRPFRMAAGLMHGYTDVARRSARRSPVDSRSYRLFRELRRRGAMPIEDAEAYLPQNAYSQKFL